jgi:hypothetical protein
VQAALEESTAALAQAEAAAQAAAARAEEAAEALEAAKQRAAEAAAKLQVISVFYILTVFHLVIQDLHYYVKKYSPKLAYFSHTHTHTHTHSYTNFCRASVACDHIVWMCRKLPSVPRKLRSAPRRPQTPKQQLSLPLNNKKYFALA